MNTSAPLLPLFDTGPLVLFDDAEGGMRYWPAWLDPDAADTLFVRLRDGIAWRSEQRPMYDRIVDVPRLYGSIALESADPAYGLRELAERIAAVAPAAYSHAGLNFYRDGRDSVAMHHDRTGNLAEGAPIAILSLGAPRDMLIRRQGKGARALRITLEPGSQPVHPRAWHSQDHACGRAAHQLRIPCAQVAIT